MHCQRNWSQSTCWTKFKICYQCQHGQQLNNTSTLLTIFVKNTILCSWSFRIHFQTLWMFFRWFSYSPFRFIGRKRTVDVTKTHCWPLLTLRRKIIVLWNLHFFCYFYFILCLCWSTNTFLTIFLLIQHIKNERTYNYKLFRNVYKKIEVFRTFPETTDLQRTRHGKGRHWPML